VTTGQTTLLCVERDGFVAISMLDNTGGCLLEWDGVDIVA